MKVVDQVSTRILRQVLAAHGKLHLGGEVTHDDVDDVTTLDVRVGTQVIPMHFTNEEPTQEKLEDMIRSEFEWALDNRPVRRFKRRK